MLLKNLLMLFVTLIISSCSKVYLKPTLTCEKTINGESRPECKVKAEVGTVIKPEDLLK